MPKKIFIISCILFLQACASSKAYVGETRPSSEVATIYRADIQKFGTVDKQWIWIKQVNELTVGNDAKGYPEKIEVLPGKNKIIVKFDTMTLGKAVLSGTGQAVGGVIGGALKDTSKSLSQMANNEFIANVEKGKTYKINFSSNTHSIDDLKVWIEPFSPK